MNGEKLKENLNIDINPNKLDQALKHVSFLNIIREEKKVIELNKTKAMVGRDLISLVNTMYFYMERDEDRNTVQSISDYKILTEQIDKYYGLNNLVYLSEGEEKNNRLKYYPDIVATVFYEIYDSCGFNTVYELIRPILLNYSGKIDYKTKLQEYVQDQKGAISYEIIKEVGKDNNKVFTVKLSALGKQSIAEGFSKTNAEQEAAQKYFFENKINFNFYNKVSNSNLRNKKVWEVTSKRRNEFNELRKVLNLSRIDLPDFILDVCFTHKSFINTHKDYESNEYLSYLGSYVLKFHVDLYILKHFDTICTNDSKLFSKQAGIIVKSDSIMEMYKTVFNEKILSYINLVNGYQGDKKLFIPDMVKSILGGLYINSLLYKNISIDKCENLVKNILRKIEIQEIDDVDYSPWLVDFATRMGIDIKFINEYYEGTPNNRTYYGEVKIYLSQYNLNDITFKSNSSSIKNLHFDLAKRLYSYINKTFNLNYVDINRETSEGHNLFLRDLIQYSLKKNNSFYITNIKMLGGLCLDKWDANNANNIINNLMYRMLFSELKLIYNLWKDDYRDINPEKLFKGYDINLFIDSPEKVEIEDTKKISTEKTSQEIKFDCNHNDNKDIIVTTKVNKSGLLDTNCNFIEKDEFNAIVFTKVYYFESNICTFCESELNKVDTLIQVKSENKYKIFETNVPSCPICGIRGINRENEDELQRLNFEVSLYKGSPSFYSSSIINMNKVSVIAKASTTKIKKDIKRKKTTSQQELDKQLIIKKKLGEEGEKYVLAKEKNYLIDIGRPDLADKVKLVSQFDCSAGYDILSFDENGSSKYIEVKSTTSNLSSFFMSSNEIETSKILGDSYFIYKVNNVRSNPYIIKIQNPSKNIDSGQWLVKATQYSITMK